MHNEENTNVNGTEETPKDPSTESTNTNEETSETTEETTLDSTEGDTPAPDETGNTETSENLDDGGPLEDGTERTDNINGTENVSNTTESSSTSETETLDPTVDHNVTKEDLENNPELSEEGVKEGDKVEVHQTSSSGAYHGKDERADSELNNQKHRGV